MKIGAIFSMNLAGQRVSPVSFCFGVRKCWTGGTPILPRKFIGRAAFTLIEIMIAIAIFGVVLIAIYSSWSAILRGANAGKKAAAEAQRTRMALRSISEALASAQLFAANIKHYSFIADTSGDFGELSFVARLPASFPGSGMFGDQTVRRVTFAVDPQNRLLLMQSPLLEPVDRDSPPYTIVLAPNVSLFQIEFLETNKFEWISEWPFTNQLPKVVRVALGFGEKGRRLTREDMAVQTMYLSSLAIPRDLQVSALRGRALPPTGPRTGVPQNDPAQVPQPNPRGGAGGRDIMRRPGMVDPRGGR
ncbi:MAG: prepilin-type N-terminal cleavage/methylation domain-containing protein [Verrucomicrobia bacterium]|nr:prepilin-type N-terminal cleavage/methylation domain-containing protein [Verrucomicrobiota bacterium]